MPEAKLPRYRLLVIEEEPDTLWFFEKVFRRFPQIEFFGTRDPKEAVEIAERVRPDVVISEIYFGRLQYLTGEWLIDRIKELCPAVKLIVTTAVWDEEVEERFSKKRGVEDKLLKPYSLEDLVKKTFEALNEPYPLTPQNPT